MLLSLRAPLSVLFSLRAEGHFSGPNYVRDLPLLFTGTFVGTMLGISGKQFLLTSPVPPASNFATNLLYRLSRLGSNNEADGEWNQDSEKGTQEFTVNCTSLVTGRRLRG